MTTQLINDRKKLILNNVELARSKKLTTPQKLSLNFWGTRGSIPVSGPNYMRYGGNTSCVSVSSDSGHLFIFDCGSGLRNLGETLLNQPKNESLKGYVFISHTHWDHIQGFPFFGPIFRPGNNFNIMGYAENSENLVEILAGQMQQNYFPVSLYSLPSELGFHAIQKDSKPLYLDGAKVSTITMKHPLPTLAFRLDLAAKSIVYATDHEPLSVPEMKPGQLLGFDVIDEKIVKLARNADILIHDAQYSNDELCCKVGWGHNTAEIAVDTAVLANVKTLVLYHHDPAHSDTDVDALLVTARRRAVELGNNSLQIIAAGDGLTMDI